MVIPYIYTYVNHLYILYLSVRYQKRFPLYLERVGYNPELEFNQKVALYISHRLRIVFPLLVIPLLQYGDLNIRMPLFLALLIIELYQLNNFDYIQLVYLKIFQ